MTIPSNSGNNPPISMSDINNDSADGFGLGDNLNGYKGQIYHQKSGGSVGLFPTGSISFSDFYGKRRVDAGSGTDTTAGTKNYTVPPYRTISFTLRAGSGGGGGGGGGSNNSSSCAGIGGGSGGAGGSSIFGSSTDVWYLSCSGGGNGTGGTANADGVSPANGTDGSDAANYDTTLSRASAGTAGGDGGRAGGSGGRGGKLSTITFTNPVLGGSGPVSGNSVPLTIGNAGSAGSGGQGGNWQISGNSGPPNWSPIYSCARNSAGRDGGNGGAGAGGYLSASWT